MDLCIRRVGVDCFTVTDLRIKEGVPVVAVVNILDVVIGFYLGNRIRRKKERIHIMVFDGNVEFIIGSLWKTDTEPVFHFQIIIAGFIECINHVIVEVCGTAGGALIWI